MASLKEEEFIQKYFIEELERLQQNDFNYYSALICCQIIESMGAFLDKKPFAAPAQSKKRFDEAISILFSSDYNKINQNSWFYHKFRCNLLHYFSVGRHFYLDNGSTDKHLCPDDNGRIVFSIQQFNLDTIEAAKFLLHLFEKNQIKRKKSGNILLDFGS